MRVLCGSIILVVAAVAPVAFAFTASKQVCLTIRNAQLKTAPPHMSSTSPLDDDELSKLIGKRDSIKKKRQERQQQPPQPPSLSDDESGDENATPPPKISNLEEMPELKTKRPPRKPRITDDDDPARASPLRDRLSGTRGKSSSSSSTPVGADKGEALDFLMDYDDENELHIPNRIGFGTAAWGESKRGFVGEGKLTKKMKRAGMFVPGDLQVAYNLLLESGISFVDTSESYGATLRPNSLSAEHILGRCMEENVDYSPLVASTFTNPWTSLLQGTSGVRIGGRAVLKAIKNSCARMETSGIELYQVQNAFLYPGGRGALADGLAMALDRGYCNYVGICNVGRRGMKSFARKLEKRGVTLTSNQFAFSLTNRKALKSGLIDACKDLGVIPLAHTPLDGGLASGVFTATNPSGGQAGGQARYDFKLLEKLQPLHSVQESVATRVGTRLKREQREIGDRYRRYGPPPKINTDITTTQVAINYVVAKGAVPLPGINTPKQAEELLGCLGWSLTEEEVQMLDNAAELCGR